MSLLPRAITDGDGKNSSDALRTSWADLVEQLALGPEPEVRECPSCRCIGMSEAKRCGYCWARLSPPAKRDAGVEE